MTPDEFEIEVQEGTLTITRPAYNDIHGWVDEWTSAPVEDVLEAILEAEPARFGLFLHTHKVPRFALPELPE